MEYKIFVLILALVILSLVLLAANYVNKNSWLSLPIGMLGAIGFISLLCVAVVV